MGANCTNSVQPALLGQSIPWSCHGGVEHARESFSSLHAAPPTESARAMGEHALFASFQCSGAHRSPSLSPTGGSANPGLFLPQGVNRLRNVPAP
jgi:hypothetical protein